MNEWISVKDRLPERLSQGFRTYIVASYSPNRKLYSIGAYNWIDNHFSSSYGEKLEFDDGYWIITHWMPLPEPPEKI